MEHPLLPDLSNLTLDQLQEKITELNRKLTIGMRSGNAGLCNQIRMALQSYQSAYQTKISEQYRKNGPNFQDKIDIS